MSSLGSMVQTKSRLLSSTIHHSSQLDLFNSLSKVEQMVEKKHYCEQEQARVSFLIENECNETEVLKTEINNLTKMLDKLKHESLKVKKLVELQTNQFQNLQSVQYLAAEKNTKCKINLRDVKQEIKEICKIEDNYFKKQQEQMTEMKKQIRIGEEFVSHY